MKSRLIFFLFLFHIYCFSQSICIPFCKNLYLQEKYEDLNVFTTQLISTTDSSNFDNYTIDTLKFFCAKARLKLNPNDSSVLSIRTYNKHKGLSLLKISFLLRGKMNKDIDSILAVDEINDSAGVYLIKIYQKLLNSQNADAEVLLNKYDPSRYSFKYQILIHDVKLILEKDKAFKRKSPIKSALLSAVLPGFGKRYVGYNGEAVSALLNNAVLGLVLSEAIWRKGVKSPYTIGVGLIFSTFYFSNISGSYYAAKRLNFQHKRYIDAEIQKNITRWSDSIIE